MLSGPNRSVATKVWSSYWESNWGTDHESDCYDNCLVCANVMEGTGKHRASFQILENKSPGGDPYDTGSHSADGNRAVVYIGIVRDGAASHHSQMQSWPSNFGGWFMFGESGSLFVSYREGKGKDDGDDTQKGTAAQADGAGKIKSGGVLTLDLDLDVGSLKFLVDGKPHGPGFTSGSGIAGTRVRWAVSVGNAGVGVQIVPTI